MDCAKQYTMNTQDKNTAGLESTHTKGSVPNVGTGPAPAIADGGVPGEEKQPKENTGNMTEMGGATVGTSKLDLENDKAE